MFGRLSCSGFIVLAAATGGSNPRNRGPTRSFVRSSPTLVDAGDPILGQKTSVRRRAFGLNYAFDQMKRSTSPTPKNMLSCGRKSLRHEGRGDGSRACDMRGKFSRD